MRRLLSKSPILVVLFLIAGMLPLSLPAAAQDDNCPEGLVYYEPDEICLLPENVPTDEPVTDDAGNEPVDDAADDVTDDLTDDASDETDTPDDDTDTADDLVDPADGEDDDTTDEEPLDTTEDGQEQDSADDAADGDGADMEDVVEDPTGVIANLTLVSYACPALWDPATKGVDESRTGCAEVPDAETSYTILFAGTEQLTVPAPAGIDLASAGVPLTPGTWTIRENGGEGDPYASCIVTAANGTVVQTIAQAVPGGSLDVELGDGEILTCEWFSTQGLAGLVGEGSGAIPSLTVASGFCPYGIGNFFGSNKWYLDEHKAICHEAPGVVAYSLLYGETLVASQTTTDTLPVDMVLASAQLVTGGTYRLAAEIPNPYLFSYAACIVTEAAGTTRYEEERDPIETDTLTEIVLDLNAGETVACYFYYMDPVVKSGPLEEIEIHFFVCPYGTTSIPDVYYNPTQETDCTLSAPAPIFVDYLLNDQVVGSGSFINTPSILNVTENGGTPNAGTWTLRLRDVPADWLANEWRCHGLAMVPGMPDKGHRQIDLDLAQLESSTFRATIGPNQRLLCTVKMTKPVADDFIHVGPTQCPDGVDPAALAPGDRLSQCSSTSLATFQFLIDDQPVTPVSRTDQTDVMAPLTPGQLRIVTTPEAGKTLRLVNCDLTISSAPGQVQTIEPAINEDGVSITLDVKAGDTLSCTWFFANLPATTELDPELETEPTPSPTPEPKPDDPPGTGETTETTEPASPQVPATGNSSGTGSGSSTGNQAQTGESDPGSTSSLEIRHWDCPASIPGEPAYEDLLLACTASVDDSSWVIEGLQPGPLQITVGDDATSLVSCGSDGADDNDVFPAFIPVDNGAITIEILPATTVYCDWFVHQ